MFENIFLKIINQFKKFKSDTIFVQTPSSSQLRGNFSVAAIFFSY
jgi:hypothetical protein